ncbi:MAG: toll/interleukin-1 receptor domain-containing protein [Pseudomonadota bacterium]
MSVVTIGQALLAADRALSGRYVGIERILKDAVNTSATSFDVFLSHSKMDDKYVLGAKQILEEKGFSVYVDWINDPQLDRSMVTKRTADYLRQRMKQCSLMFYLHTKNSSLSKWCPWEMGFFDGNAHSAPRTYVFPLVFSGESFQGQEYLELYPTIDIDDVGKVTQLKKDVWGKFSSNERQWRQISGVLAEVG